MSVPPTFFVDHKRGEVNELKALLNNPAFFKQPDKRREIIKKVIELQPSYAYIYLY